MMKTNLRDKVVRWTAEKDLFAAPCHVLLGLSGGADSMVLLDVLTHWPDAQLQVSAVHINHGLRGECADRDEAFVRQYCEDRGILLTVIHADVAAVARDSHLTVEEAGRQVRYEQFEQVRSAIGADYVLTAHTADDHVETVLMHILRGCGIDGLAGIPVARGIVRRPLLACSREEIEEYCVQNGVPFVTDETNEDTKYVRNRVRHRVLPLLKEINPSVGDAVLRLSRCASEDADYLNCQAAEALQAAQCADGYYVDRLMAQSSVIRRRMIRMMMREKSLSSIAESHILAADDAIMQRKGSVSLCDEYVFSVEQSVVSIRKDNDIVSPLSVALDILPCRVSFGAFECTLSECSDNTTNVHKLFLQSSIDCDKIVGKLSLRSRQTGDYLHPVGRGVGKSLKKLMNEWHIPAHLRNTYPLLCDESGVVLVPGYACDERVACRDTTKHYLVCEISKVQG